ncbi:MAG: acetyl-CoA carboxylase biotin carboxylase subunit [Ignavibacteria bacterium]|nr:acetyl-CoA carboxylase biotin carboxylase subunit [Ignavibacteria bacterium]
MIMFKKILIANRGEIAVRVINTAREMGIKTVAVYSDFDKYSLFARKADEAFHIGASPAAQSYLLADKLIEIAKKSGAEAIHPGYGFLSERGYFAKLCADNGIKFIGPSEHAIDFLGSKTNAKDIAVKANVPTVPGTHYALKSVEEAKEVAEKIGYPVLIKASAGGGGKGMRVVNESKDLESFMRMAQNEARSSFGDDSVFIEKYVLDPRHVEFQILADEHGNAVHLGERECSMQRRHQKVIEETPSVIMDEALRTEMGECAKRLVLESGYTNAGTVEFIVDADNKFYFLEVNTRLQVEHPITEMRTGLDLVKEQLKIAYGEKLSFRQEDIKLHGAAIECRINAEDADNNFMPSIGKINYMSKEGGNGIREDSGIEQGDEISVYYDSMISKLISYGPDRPTAIAKMKRALKGYKIGGVKTNISFLLSLLESDAFMSGQYHTQYIEKTFMKEMKDTAATKDMILAASLASTILKSSNGNSNHKAVLKNTSESKWAIRKFDNFR